MTCDPKMINVCNNLTVLHMICIQAEGGEEADAGDREAVRFLCTSGPGSYNSDMFTANTVGKYDRTFSSIYFVIL